MPITQVNPSSPANPPGEDVTKAIDGNTATKYLNFTKLNTGFTVNTSTSSIARTISITSANDFPERDPVNYTLEGSNDGSTWSSITSGSLTCSSTRFATQSFGFANAVSYSWYRVVFPSVCNASTATAMQVSEVQLYQADGAYNTTSMLYYSKIQDAIDAASSGNTIMVSAGTYAEDVTVNKSLTILGPNSAINPCSGSRNAEAIVVPATNAVETGEIFHIEASNVTISGFMIDGHNAGLASSGVTNTVGVDMNAGEGVTIYVDNVSNLHVTNNIMKNLSYSGVTIYGASYSAPATSGHVISNNMFQDLGTYNDPSTTAYNVNRFGFGVLLYNSQYAAISSNCMNNVRNGVQTGNFHQTNPGLSSSQVIDNNAMINVRRGGIFHNLHTGSPSPYTLSNNTITGTSNANETLWDGISLSSLSVASYSTNNTITATAVSQASQGYNVWNVNSSNPAAISGGNVTGASTGVLLTNYSPNFGNATDGANASLTGISINPTSAGTGIRVYDDPSSTHAGAQLSISTGVTITNGANGLIVENPAASVTSLSNIAFSGQAANYIKLINNANNLNATSATFGGQTGATATLAQTFAIEDKIVHKIDNASLGFVSVKANNDYVTTNSFVVPNTTASIQRGVDAAANGYTVNVALGTYNESVSINKQLTLSGAQAGNCAASRSASESIINCVNGIGISASGVTIDGFTIQGQTSQSGPGFGYAVYMGTSSRGTHLVNNIIQNNVIGSSLSNSGTSPAQVLINCNLFNSNNNSGPASGAGIYTDEYTGGGVVSNVMISNNKFTGQTDAGIDISTSQSSLATTGVTISNNDFDGNYRAAFLYNTVSSSFAGNYVHNSTGTGTGDVRIYGGVNNFAVSNNIFSGNAPHAVRITNDGGSAVSANITVHENSFIGYSAANVAVENASGYTGTLNATCNWFGSNNTATVSTQVSGAVTYIPYLSSGTDVGGNPYNGFQPSVPCSGSCILTAGSAVAPLYPMSGQEIQTIYLGYPSSAQTEAVTATTSGGTGSYTYTWTRSGACLPTADLGNNAATYNYAPGSADACNNNADNIYTFSVLVVDNNGCTATTSKKINVVNPYVSTGDVQICHKVAVRGGSTTQLLIVSPSQVSTHLAHGDYLGNCAVFTGVRSVASVEAEEQKVAVYPNPTTGVFILELSSINDEANILITDISGKMVGMKTIAKGEVPTATFDLSSFAKGMYLIQVRDGELNYRTKIVVQ